MKTLASTLEEAIRESGEGWLIDSFTPPEKAIEHLGQVLLSVHELARRRGHGECVDLSENSLIEIYNRTPAKLKGFFQALGGTRTPEMLLMAWRIIQGMEIKSVQIAYQMRESFRAKVTLVSPYGQDPEEHYETSSVQDFALFRHIGIMEIGQEPVLDGFYALKLK